MSTFRKYGGTNYSANHNVTRSFISNSEQMNINNSSGQENSKEKFASHIDMSGNSILQVGTIYFYDGTSMNTAPIGGTGSTGIPGPPGPTGANGNPGATGANGNPGATGANGNPGATGANGNPGSTGPQGDPGIPGATGPQGDPGIPGATGPQGDPGIPGATGPQGDPGATGPQGDPGATGPQGATGATGATGPAGTGISYWTPINTNDIINNNSGNVIIGPTGQTAGTGPNLDVNGIINVNGKEVFSSVITVTATNPLNVPTLQTSVNSQYHYLEFVNPDTYNITLIPTIINFNYILVGAGGAGATGTFVNGGGGGGGGGYVIGTSIPNTTLFSTVIGATGSSSTLTIDTGYAVATSGSNAPGGTPGGNGGQGSVNSSQYGIGYTGINGGGGSATTGSQFGVGGSSPPLSVTFGSTTIQYEIGGITFYAAGSKGGGGAGGFADVGGGAGGYGYMLLYFLVPLPFSTITITPKYIQFPDGTQQTTAGVTFTSTTTTTRMSVANTATDIATITVSNTGFYLVEGNYLFSGTTTVLNQGMLSLSTTSLTYDNNRKIVTTFANQSINSGNHITSVFNVNSVPTTFYLIGEVSSNLNVGTLQYNYMAVTKIA